LILDDPFHGFMTGPERNQNEYQYQIAIVQGKYSKNPTPVETPEVVIRPLRVQQDSRNQESGKYKKYIYAQP
jgi:hypothetical protein